MSVFPREMGRLERVIASCTILLALIAPGVIKLSARGDYILHVILLSFTLALLSLSWDILASCGQISFGHAAFFGTGAYVSALLSFSGLEPPIALVAAGVFGAALGVGIGSVCFRLRGPYFALSMLAFAEICKLVVINMKSVTRGPRGLFDIPPLLPKVNIGSLTIDFYRGKVGNYYVILGMLIVAAYLAYKLKNSRIGIAFVSISEDEDAATTTGVNPLKYKLIAIAISGFLGAISGAFYAHYTHNIEPDHVYGAAWTILPVVSSLFGGIGYVAGPIAGSILVWCIDELIFKEMLSRGHKLLLGALLVLVIIYMPKGVIDKVREHVLKKGEH